MIGSLGFPSHTAKQADPKCCEVSTEIVYPNKRLSPLAFLYTDSLGSGLVLHSGPALGESGIGQVLSLNENLL